MTLQFRAAILECDTPLPGIQSQFGTYGDLIEGVLRQGLQSCQEVPDVDLVVSKWDVVHAKSYPPTERVDCIILTGAKYNAFDDDDWILQLVSFVRNTYETSTLLIIGICFGHQIIARALGGRVERSEKGWEVSVDKVSLNVRGAELFRANELNLYQMHRDVVVYNGGELMSLGSSDKCDIQGFLLPGRIFSVQGHPEFNTKVMRELLVTRFEQKIFDHQLFTDAMSRSALPQDGILVARAMWRFLLHSTES